MCRLFREKRDLKLKYIIVLAFAVIVFIIMSCQNVFISHAKEAGKPQRVINVGYNDYDGFLERDNHGNMTGYGYDYLMEIARYTGWKYNFVYGSWETQLKNLKSGKIDIVCQAQKTEEHCNDFIFSNNSVGIESNVLYARKDDERYYYNDYKHFNGMKVALLKESYQNDEFQKFSKEKDFKCEYIFFETTEGCFAALNNKKVDAVAVGSLSLQSDYKVISKFGTSMFYFMANPQKADIISEINFAMSDIYISNPELQNELYKKHYSESVISSDIQLTREESRLIRDIKAVEVVFIPSKIPFSYINDFGEPDGIMVDIMREICKKAGITMKAHFMEPSKKTIDYIKEHKNVFVAGINCDNPDFLGDNYVVSEKFYSDQVILAGHPEKFVDYTSGDKRYKVCIQKSYSALKQYIEKNYPMLDIVEASSRDEAIELVREDKVDYMADNINVLTVLLSNPKNSNITMYPSFFMKENIGVVALNTTENNQIIDIFNKCIQTIPEEDVSAIVASQIKNNTYHATYKDILYRYRFIIAFLLSIFVIIVAALIVILKVKEKSNMILLDKQRELSKAVRKADQANEAKGQFLARISHELRTPMNAIIGCVNVSKNHTDEPGKIMEYLNKISRSSQVLLRTLNDILDMTAFEHNGFVIVEEKFKVSDVILYIKENYESQCCEKHLELNIDSEAVCNNNLIGDVARINQVLLNLVSNAYKFTDEGGRINVIFKEEVIDEDNIKLIVYVKDNGVGISREMKKNIYEPFVQEEFFNVRKFGGNGIGLYIVKGILDAMNGEIAFSSEKNVGTEFVISIPLVIDNSAAENESEKQEEDTGKKTSNIDANGNYDFGGRKVLMAEDIKLNAEIMKELLKMVNIKVDHAENGQIAFEMFKNSKPGTYCAILMDIQMPVMDGYEATRCIRRCNHEDAKMIAIYAVSANSFEKDIQMSLDVGMNEHLPKPVDTKRLFKLLDEEITKKES